MQIEHTHSKLHSERGFTLVELAVVLIVFGLVVSTIALGFRFYFSGQAENTTWESISESHLAMFEFQLIYGRYPCPADPTLGPGDADFGKEQCTPGIGVRRVPGFRDADNDGNLDNVLIGAFPFQTIIDPNDDTPNGDNTAYEDYIAKYGFDGWNRKLTFAVTENLTAPQTYRERWGAIDIVHENNFDDATLRDPDNLDASLLDTRGTAHFAVLSHGQSGKGAYSKNGELVEICAVSTPKQEDIDEGVATKIDETLNCRRQEGVFLSGLKNETRKDYNDDSIKFMTLKKANLWEHSGIEFDDRGTPETDDDIEINKVSNTNGGNIGIGIDDPQQRLHVDGELQAFAVHAVGLCDEAGNDCMNPEAIAGELENMQCPENQVITKIEENRVTCTNPFDSVNLSGRCPSGTFLRGFSSKSGIICR